MFSIISSSRAGRGRDQNFWPAFYLFINCISARTLPGIWIRWSVVGGLRKSARQNHCQMIVRKRERAKGQEGSRQGKVKASRPLIFFGKWKENTPREEA